MRQHLLHTVVPGLISNACGHSRYWHSELVVAIEHSHVVGDFHLRLLRDDLGLLVGDDPQRLQPAPEQIYIVSGAPWESPHGTFDTSQITAPAGSAKTMARHNT